MSDQPPPGPNDPFGQQPGWGAPDPPPAGPPPAVPPGGNDPGQPPGWGSAPPGWGAPPPGYPTPPPGYGAPPPGYGTPPPGYGAPPAYGAPGYGYGAAMGPKPDSYLVPAILTTLFCCLPAGIAAIVFAAQVDNRYSQGDYQGAVESSRKAKQWMWISVGLGVVAILLWIVLIAVGESTSDPYYYD